ncbi:uncharacterized protein HD556DRAFT_1479403 [Suillus plorans]|uniref:DUF6533 domain-containing protein n=1 Tax=Suillus plorans TaxID=116603 RepID=A0A9P7DHT2_9AGAM|nr:uncharacterized protein HD556DRAFT_1479403 [Suillus plorans]KAG1793301.1 hypothetical protein HD556DRAFT_1479403 [Suillus plorans]
MYTSLLTTVIFLNIGKQSRAAALGLLIYEHIITFEDEIDLIWLKKKSWVTYLYHFNVHYTNALWRTAGFQSYGSRSTQHSKYNKANMKQYHPSCVTYMLCNNIIALLMTVSVQTTLQLRGSPAILYEKSPTNVLQAMMALLIGLTIARVERFPVVSTPAGCLFEGLAPLSAIFWTPALIFEPVICILILKKVFLDRQQRSELATFLARDRIFMQLIGSSIVWARYPSYINLFMPWSIVLPSLLCNRLLLNVRGRFARGSEPVPIELAILPSSVDSFRMSDEE